MKQGPKRARGRALVVGDGQHVAVADAAGGGEGGGTISRNILRSHAICSYF